MASRATPTCCWRSPMGERKSVKVGRATVSWGPRTYGADAIIASCPVASAADLVEAVRLAYAEITAEGAVNG